ncbi:cytochrome c oxidase subunit II [Parachryseolinea silvisoli]|jgi:cytochrome c oxidase subunit 2|uniref:cytochrome c oxidase subunit II n=1 Tax=Parachryseolinea silvisoli TaxID=2873601 RepID=UPI002265EA04|nr:cytochrome c oxidase subunit II [Parachryseolinea silvisoli]MCD9017453.1 cytochrome c oxidase subunit II [Parachryseolinea silvisoli]
MMSLIIVLGVVLVLGILFLIFRISTLVGIAKGKKEELVSPNNGIHAVLFVVFLVGSLALFFWYSITRFHLYTLPIASVHGKETDRLFWITMAITVIAFVIISIIMFVFLYQYRYNPARRAKFFPDNHYLELTWTIIPAIVLALLIFTGLRTWNDITGPASKDAEVVELIAQQFAWTARYPGVKDKSLGKVNYKLIDAVNEFGLDLSDKNSFDDFKSLELHLPVGQEVLLKIRAKDVIHSVFLPHFRVKMDAVPGMPTQFKFKATKTTEQMRDELGNPNFNYELACTEICGRGHFSMKMSVIVEEQEAYERWKASQEAWLKQNPDYLNKVPAELKEAAMIKAGMQADPGAGVAAVKE